MSLSAFFPSNRAETVLLDWQRTDRKAEAFLAMRDGTRIKLWFALPEDAEIDTPMILILHGAGMHAGYYQPMARMLAAKGYIVAMMDQRGHGHSEGQRGDIDHPDVYCEDVTDTLRALAKTGLGLVVAAHSGAAAMALRVLATARHPAVTGFAMMTPTFADDGGMVRRSTGGRDMGAYFRYMLTPNPAPAPPPAANSDGKGGGNSMSFNLRRFLFYRLTRLMGAGPVLTYVPSRAGEDPYTYSARGVHGSMVGAIGPLLQALRVPVFLATGGQDQFVSSDAVRMTLPWFIDATLPLAVEHEPRSDHFTTLLVMVPKLDHWIRSLAPLLTGQRQ